MHDQEIWRRGDHADRIEILAGIVAEIGMERRRGAERAAGGHQQGVTVGRRLGDRARRHRAAGAAAIVDHDLLAKASLILSATLRAAVLELPPGGNGTTSVIVRSG